MIVLPTKLDWWHPPVLLVLLRNDWWHPPGNEEGSPPQTGPCHFPPFNFIIKIIIKIIIMTMKTISTSMMMTMITLMTFLSFHIYLMFAQLSGPKIGKPVISDSIFNINMNSNFDCQWILDFFPYFHGYVLQIPVAGAVLWMKIVAKSHEMGFDLDMSLAKKPMQIAKSQIILRNQWNGVLFELNKSLTKRRPLPKKLFCKKAKEVAKYHKIGFGLKMSLTRTSSAGFPTDKCIYSPSHPT